MCETLKRSVDVTVCEVVTPWVYPERQFPRRATVSVVIPTLNEASNVAHVLPMLPFGIDQVILVDGGSTDGTVDVARRVASRMWLWSSKRGGGRATPWRVVFTAATGDIIVVHGCRRVDSAQRDLTLRRNTRPNGSGFRLRLEVRPGWRQR